MLKCVIWDLDDTLWRGTLNDGDELILSPSACKLVKELDAAGIIQSIASRNDLTSAMNQLKKFELESYFLYPQINGLSKVYNINKIIKQLNIGFDSVVFIDDNEFEISQVNYFLPQIRTVTGIEELELMFHNHLENSSVNTYESTNRRELMDNRRKRQEESEQFKGTSEQFLLSCNMNLTVRRAQNKDLVRVEELAVRTNQLNSFKKKLEKSTIENFMSAENKQIYVCELEDRFGNHGIVGTCFIEVIEDSAVIKQFCISCRIEGRGLGYSFLSTVIQNVQKQYSELSKIICNYSVTSKNSAALYLLKALGFKYSYDMEDFKAYAIAVPQKYSEVKWLTIINKENDENGI